MARHGGGSLGVLGLAALIGLPAAVALGGLVAFGRLAPLPALGALAVIVALGSLLMRPLAGNVARFARFTEALGDPAPPALPTLVPAPFAGDLGEAARRARRAVEAREQRAAGMRTEAQKLLDSLPDALLIVGRDGRVARANRAARTLFGDAVEGRDMAAAMRHPALLAAVDDVLTSAMAETVELDEPGPPQRAFEATVESLPWGEGPAVLVAIRDRTAVKRAEQLRADFVANASHEIRSPLATVVGFIETLRGPARDDAEARERFLAIMAEQAGRMTRLVQDLLSLSRIEMNEHTVPSGRVAVARVLGRVRDTLGWEAGQKGMTITLDIVPDLPDVHGEEPEIEQIFHNLIGNSVKYGHRDSAITVAAGLADPPPPAGRWPAGGAVRIAVGDRSDGIPREHIPRLTERFYRVDAARSRSLGGTGLGLAIVKHIVNRHRGLLTIESTPGEGSVFTVHLPVA